MSEVLCLFGFDGYLVAGPGGCQSDWTFAHTLIACGVVGAIGWVVGKIRGADGQ